MNSPRKTFHPPATVHAALAGIVLGLAVLLAGVARADRPYAPSRDYHLQNVRVSLRFARDQRKVIGEVTHTLSTLRDGLTHLDFDCADLTISSARVNGKDAPFELRDDKLRVGLPQPAKSGEKFEVNLRYEGKPTSGLYFILPDKDDPRQAKLDARRSGRHASLHSHLRLPERPRNHGNDSDRSGRLAHGVEWEAAQC